MNVSCISCQNVEQLHVVQGLCSRSGFGHCAAVAMGWVGSAAFYEGATTSHIAKNKKEIGSQWCLYRMSSILVKKRSQIKFIDEMFYDETLL